MVRNFIIGLLAVAVVATGIWGFQEREEKQVLKVTAENNYQRAFHELAFHIDQIEDQLGATLAMNSRRQLTPALADVWRIVSLAQENIGQLPLSSVELGKTEEFLFKLGRFSYRTSIRDLEKEPLTDNEYETLQKLYEYSKDIREEVRYSQAMMMANGDQWIDIDEELAASHEPLDNMVVTNLEVMNKSIESYSETDWGAGLAAIDDINGELKNALDGEPITEEEAERIAREYLQVGEQATVNVSETGNGLAYPAYTIVIDDPDHETNYYMDVSVNGGEPIWFLQDRQINEQSISLNEAVEIANEYLEENGKENMQLVDSRQYDSIALLEFVHLEDNVRVYNDLISLEVALDDGDILGYEAKAYIINHKERDIPEPEITSDEARERLNPRLEIMEDHIAVIKNDLGEEVLCYEFLGVIDNDTYRIFINAEDGEEEKVDRLNTSEPVYDFTDNGEEA
ncbi:germination protein YpeB [Halalkalibacter akibai]|uniref:Spore germination protein YpeB n=1 Tax=Halalkalibacter akibai (strain ATCC 43226 / DSM 21942 / CIP 109018 / JCM 9157 / 1139) TaxID=1236973 RepID=W4QR07_HALA3|nr:germination protein YpeB [Halalkalibacter akibai]GAE34530.1 spore germination protein YpeB [Halalkalibacter akibai JCM 9157]